MLEKIPTPYFQYFTTWQPNVYMAKFFDACKRGAQLCNVFFTGNAIFDALG